ncbi:flavin monoamine oxidase family protein [Chitinasiproducens palmae]|uniref:NAD(P)-binding Rossmann-like domain-containing protein n=1 Tax=Chitinasiproducens palmae TaxID=1770053 RepID=A0A1H2PTZ3_9BURK|nr:FAD-dependent oxidoreductase [Chitinasiproducens palmae]SDV50258.1 NAD(P)-binding Rossmann-like domain-containing protein [Chitinasiproducens palmae]
MLDARVAIVGGGLSGLYAAFLLEQAGIDDYLLLEARETLGGRIASVPLCGQRRAALDCAERGDLGPAWFWPAYQAELDRLISDLGMSRFEQYEAGDMVVERSPQAPPVRMCGHGTTPRSMRLAGGMSALVAALRRRLESGRLVINQPARRLHITTRHVDIVTDGAGAQRTSYRVDHVLLALPPRLAGTTLDFFPALPEALLNEWRATPTWMASHAKYIAAYDAPFWREQGLSGEGRSARGPLAELHDASIPGGAAALFGFFGVPAHARRDLGDEMLRSLCRAQLTRLFGPQAAKPIAEVIKDWAREPYTATTADEHGAAQHLQAPAPSASSGIWQSRLTGIASEWSRQFPGYLAGAIDAAGSGVQAYLRRMERQHADRRERRS